MKEHPGNTYIGKPSRGSGGEGIFLMKRPLDMPSYTTTKEYIVQRYIERPLMIDKKKFDLRICVLIKGFNPI